MRRDQVALIAFRDETAELLLPPTRSLVRAKKALSGSAGRRRDTHGRRAGSHTRHGRAREGNRAQPCTVHVLLTDGAANVARDGTRNREAGTRDALAAARSLSMSPANALIIDTAQRPQPRAKELADALRGAYIALPKADAKTLNRAIRAAST